MRGPPVGLRELTAEEASAVDSLARSRTAAARRVERPAWSGGPIRVRRRPPVPRRLG